MSKAEKLAAKILSGKSDKNFAFNDLCYARPRWFSIRLWKRKSSDLLQRKSRRDRKCATAQVTFRPLLATLQLCPKFGNVSQSVVKIDPEIMSGAPCFAGTRVPIQNFIDYLEGGDSIEDFLEGFPSVSREQVIAFLEEAKDRMLAAASK
jgi:uncharacterized protein (DUF433 family)